MLRLAADENFNGSIVRGLMRRGPALDIARVQDVGLSGADDDAVLEWAARERRVLMTHDVSTLVMQALNRVGAGRPMSGVFAVPSTAAIGQAIDDLSLLAASSFDDEWDGQVLYLPLR